MSSFSARLNLSLLAEGQASGEITVNESMNALDAFVQGSVKSRTTTAEPGSPSNGDTYILGGSPTGTNWSTQANKLAFYYNGWRFFTRREGMVFWVQDADEFSYFDGSNWQTWKPAAADADVVDSSGGTASGTIASIGVTYSQTEVRDAVATLAAEINDLKAKLRTAGLLKT